ncbi:hypothetical protein, partial [Bradyrhizobium sp.]|uniref:hypothetical protein n=1 Tax=Bradyrhizobium sp. TaxID=376 RepID=UPI00391BA00E
MSTARPTNSAVIARLDRAIQDAAAVVGLTTAAASGIAPATPAMPPEFVGGAVVTNRPHTSAVPPANAA